MWDEHCVNKAGSVGCCNRQIGAIQAVSREAYFTATEGALICPLPTSYIYVASSFHYIFSFISFCFEFLFLGIISVLSFEWVVASLLVLAWDVHYYSCKVQDLIQAVAVSRRKSQATKSIASLTSEVYVMLISPLFHWIWSSPLSFSYQTIHSNFSFQISWWGLSYLHCTIVSSDCFMCLLQVKTIQNLSRLWWV